MRERVFFSYYLRLFYKRIWRRRRRQQQQQRQRWTIGKMVEWDGENTTIWYFTLKTHGKKIQSVNTKHEPPDTQSFVYILRSYLYEQANIYACQCMCAHNREIVYISERWKGSWGERERDGKRASEVYLYKHIHKHTSPIFPYTDIRRRRRRPPCHILTLILYWCYSIAFLFHSNIKRNDFVPFLLYISMNVFRFHSLVSHSFWNSQENGNCT